ncbi:Sybindin-like family [Fragilaria crotonensis]|nr:Sybindin-like family [Fragilaria crotonensis]
MLFSLRELVGSLAPSSEVKDAGLHSVHTGAGTLHNYETVSGLRFALYTTKMPAAQNASIRGALKHIYTELWIDCVVRSPLYIPSSQGDMDLACTNFEQRLDAFLGSMPWFK